MPITGCAICMNGGVKKQFLNFKGAEQVHPTNYSAALDLSVTLNLVVDECNKSLEGKRLRHATVNAH